MQVPQHDYRVVGDAGSEKVAIDVHLPGVTDTSSIVVTIEPPDTVTVLVPDRYHLQLTLPVPISSHAESVRFKRRTSKLAMLCTVASTTEAPAAAPPPAPTAAPTASPSAGFELPHRYATAAAEPTQPVAAGSTQEQECADAAGSGAGRRQQQHADQAAAAKPGRQVKASEQPQKTKAAVAESRPDIKAAVHNDTLQVADIPAQEEELPAQPAALQQQQQQHQHQQPSFTSTGSSVPGQQQQQQPSFTSTGSSALRSVQRQQQQQGGSRAGGSQQQAVKLDAEIPQMLVELEEILQRKHDPTLVGYWCAAYDALILATAQLGLKVVYWAVSTKESKRVPFGSCSNAALLGIGLMLLSFVPTLLWQKAWLLPLSELADFRVRWRPRVHSRDGCSTDIKAAVSVERQALQNKLKDNDSLVAGLTKLLLAGVSALVVWGGLRVVCAWQLGSHSLGGWVLEVLLLVWRAAVWLWGLVVWRPPSWYPVQLLFAGLYSISSFFCGLTARKRTMACTFALAPLQVVITGGGWATVCSFALSNLWHLRNRWDMIWRGEHALTDTAAQRPAGKAAAKEGAADQLHPWWHAAAAGMLPTVARSWLLLLSRFAASQAVLSSVGGGVASAVVLLARGLGCTLSMLQAGLQLLSAACCGSLAHVSSAPLKALVVLLLGGLAAPVAQIASWLGLWWLQRAAGVVMGVLCWAAPAWYVGPLVQRACAASGVWQEGCLELLEPYAAQAPDSLSLNHSWWFTIIVHVWVGCIFRQLVACRGGESGGRWLQEERQQKLEAARQRKEQKVQQRRQQKRHGH